MKPLKIAYFGTGDFSKNILADICENFSEQISVELVVSQPDRKVGRKQILEPTAVHSYADQRGINILQPEKLKIPQAGEPELIPHLQALDLDFIVVVAYGKIIPTTILDIPKYACINIHGSILPDYRGASPIQECLKAGDSLTGLTIMYMSKGMDEGDILKIRKIEVDKLDKTPDLFTKFEQFGAELLVETLVGVVAGEITATPQDDRLATYCSKISKSDGEIDFKTMGTDDIKNRFRAYYPWPGIYAYFGDKKLALTPTLSLEEDILESRGEEIGSVIKLDKKTIGIVCADTQLLQLEQVKLEGKKSMDILSFINGNKDFLNYKF